MKVTSLDNYYNQNKVVPDLIKIDAEGFDSKVILGARNLLSEKKLRAIINQLKKFKDADRDAPVPVLLVL